MSQADESCINKAEFDQESPIGRLPHDVVLFCLARVPRKYHRILRNVCRKWRDLVCSEDWIAYRKKHSLDEKWIYALCRDKFERVSCYVLDPNSLKRYWKRISGLPHDCSRRKGMGFEVLGKKLYLMGGCRGTEYATDETYCYDASMDNWSETAALSTPRCYFACEVLEEKIYAIGGLGMNSDVPNSWDTYDPCAKKWHYQLDSNIVHEVEDSFVLDGKIYIRSGRSPVSAHVSTAVYEPSSGTWEHADADLAAGWLGPAVIVDDRLYVLDESSGTKLTMWQKTTREWLPVGRLSPLRTRPPCKLVAIGSSIFIIGKGRSTVIIDVSDAGNLNMGGMMEIEFKKAKMNGAELIGEAFSEFPSHEAKGACGEIYLVKWRDTEVAAKTICSSIASKTVEK